VLVLKGRRLKEKGTKASKEKKGFKKSGGKKRKVGTPNTLKACPKRGTRDIKEGQMDAIWGVGVRHNLCAIENSQTTRGAAVKIEKKESHPTPEARDIALQRKKGDHRKQRIKEACKGLHAQMKTQRMG